jgi:hypothetical protein
MQFSCAVTYPRPFRQPPPAPLRWSGLTVCLSKWGESQGLWARRCFSDGERLGLAPALLRFSAREPDPSSQDEAVRREAIGMLSGAFGLAEQLGVPQVCVTPGGEVYDDEDRQARLTVLLRSLNELWKRASQKGRELLLEVPIPGHLGETPEELHNILRLVDADLGLCYDVTATDVPDSLRPAVRHVRVAVADESEITRLEVDLEHLLAGWYDGVVTVESMFARG